MKVHNKCEAEIQSALVAVFKSVLNTSVFIEDWVKYLNPLPDMPILGSSN